MFGADWFDRATGSDAAAAGVPSVVAAVVGSFLGVVIRRLPEGRPIAWDRSRCEECGAALGSATSCRCSAGSCCVAAAVSAAPGSAGSIPRSSSRRWRLRLSPWPSTAARQPGSTASSAGGCWLSAGSTRGTGCCPTLLTLPLVVAGLAAALRFDPGGLTDRALGAALGYLALRVVAYVYRKLRGRDGLGARRRQAAGGGGRLGRRQRRCRR